MRRLKVSMLPPRHKFVTPISQHFIRTLRQFPASGCSDFNNMGLLPIDGAVVIQFSHRNFFSKVLCISKHRLRGQCFPHHFNSNGFEIIHRPIKTQEVHTWINFKTSWNDSSKYGRNSFLLRTEKSNIETLISKERFQSDFMGVGQRRNSESFVMIRPTDLTSHRELV